MNRINKKGQLGGLTGSIVSLVVAIIVLVMGLVIIQEIRDTEILFTGEEGCNATDTTACDEAFQATDTSLAGLGDFSDFIPIIVIAVAASVIIGLILVGFAFSNRER